MAHHYSERLNHQGDVVNHGTVRGSIHGNLKEKTIDSEAPKDKEKQRQGLTVMKQPPPIVSSSPQVSHHCPCSKYTMEVAKRSGENW